MCTQAIDSVRRQIEEDRAMKREKLAKQALAPAAAATAPPSTGAQSSVQSTGLSLLQVSVWMTGGRFAYIYFRRYHVCT